MSYENLSPEMAHVRATAADFIEAMEAYYGALQQFENTFKRQGALQGCGQKGVIGILQPNGSLRIRQSGSDEWQTISESTPIASGVQILAGEDGGELVYCTDGLSIIESIPSMTIGQVFRVGSFYSLSLTQEPLPPFLGLDGVFYSSQLGSISTYDADRVGQMGAFNEICINWFVWEDVPYTPLSIILMKGIQPFADVFKNEPWKEDARSRRRLENKLLPGCHQKGVIGILRPNGSLRIRQRGNDEWQTISENMPIVSGVQILAGEEGGELVYCTDNSDIRAESIASNSVGQVFRVGSLYSLSLGQYPYPPLWGKDGIFYNRETELAEKEAIRSLLITSGDGTYYWPYYNSPSDSMPESIEEVTEYFNSHPALSSQEADDLIKNGFREISFEWEGWEDVPYTHLSIILMKGIQPFEAVFKGHPWKDNVASHRRLKRKLLASDKTFPSFNCRIFNDRGGKTGVAGGDDFTFDDVSASELLGDSLETILQSLENLIVYPEPLLGIIPIPYITPSEFISLNLAPGVSYTGYLVWLGLVSPETLEFMLRETLRTANDVAASMADRFIAGTGGIMTHQPGSFLSDLAKDHPAFTEFANTVKSELEKKLGDFVDCNSLNLDSNGIVQAAIVNFPVQDIDIGFPIGGTQGRIVDLLNLKLKKDGTYYMKLRFIILDDFGVGKVDQYFPSLNAFWILQHVKEIKGNHRPFVNEIQIDVEFEGRYLD